LNNSKLNNSKLNFFDSFRGIAALIVAVGHARWLLWEGYSNGYKLHPDTYSIVEKFFMYFMSVFKFGHEMVMLFFVMSGFLIHYGFSKKIQDGVAKLDVSYFKKRFIRIYPVLLVALLFTYLLDCLGIFWHLPIYTSSTNNVIINESIKIDLSNNNFLENLFLYGSKVWGSNGPMWSLKLEWFFYLIYPVFYLINSKYVKSSYLVFISFSLIVFLRPVQLEFINGFFKNIIISFPIWLLGAFLADVSTGRIKINLKKFYYLIFFPFVPILINLDSELIRDYCVAIGFVGLIAFMLKSPIQFAVLEGRLFSFFSRISYSLYIIHFPILVMFSSLLFERFGGQLPQNQIFIFLGLILCFTTSYCVYYFVERPCLTFKKKFQ
jgi:peptidoglycan/LPS O-acetylase OafA/YrhL